MRRAKGTHLARADRKAPFDGLADVHLAVEVTFDDVDLPRVRIPNTHLHEIE